MDSPGALVFSYFLINKAKKKGKTMDSPKENEAEEVIKTLTDRKTQKVLISFITMRPCLIKSVNILLPCF